MVELTVSFETNFAEAAQRKQAKYVHLVEQAQAKGYTAQLVTLQVGSRGVPDLPGFEQLAHLLSLSKDDMRHLLEGVSSTALSGSFQIWCSRNRLAD